MRFSDNESAPALQKMSIHPLNFRGMQTPEDRRRFILASFYKNSRRIKFVNKICKSLKINNLHILGFTNLWRIARNFEENLWVLAVKPVHRPFAHPTTVWLPVASWLVPVRRESLDHSVCRILAAPFAVLWNFFATGSAALDLVADWNSAFSVATADFVGSAVAAGFVAALTIHTISSASRHRDTDSIRWSRIPALAGCCLKYRIARRC